jgi:hypothetical protein
LSLLKLARVISRVLLIWLGAGMEKPTPRMKATCRMAAMNRVKPKRSAGRTPAAAEGDLRTAAFIADRGGWRGAKSADGGRKSL